LIYQGKTFLEDTLLLPLVHTVGNGIQMDMDLDHEVFQMLNCNDILECMVVVLRSLQLEI